MLIRVPTDLRLQLLEPEKYPHLYKCLYGLLMLLPQSSAFAALKNRLNSVSSIGYLHLAPRTYVVSATLPTPYHSRKGSVVEAIATSLQQSQSFSPSSLPSPHHTKYEHDTHSTLVTHSPATTPSGSNFDRPNRLKGREDGIIRWGELLEKFRTVQERARRAQRPGGGDLDDGPSLGGIGDLRIGDGVVDLKTAKEPARMGTSAPPVPLKDPPAPAPTPAKARSGLGRQFGRLGGAVSGRSSKRTQQQ